MKAEELATKKAVMKIWLFKEYIVNDFVIRF